VSAAYIKRVIAHPSFFNIDFKTAEKKMQTMDQGETVIRPSSKGGNLRLVLLANQGGKQGNCPLPIISKTF